MVCDEDWEYDEGMERARLTALRILCRDCDSVCHAGRAGKEAREPGGRVSVHLARVNGITEQEAQKLLQRAFQEWTERSCLSWKVEVAPELLARFPELKVLHGKEPIMKVWDR
jgi:hypothetical protein